MPSGPTRAGIEPRQGGLERQTADEFVHAREQTATVEKHERRTFLWEGMRVRGGCVGCVVVGGERRRGREFSGVFVVGAAAFRLFLFLFVAVVKKACCCLHERNLWFAMRVGAGAGQGGGARSVQRSQAFTHSTKPKPVS